MRRGGTHRRSVNVHRDGRWRTPVDRHPYVCSGRTRSPHLRYEFDLQWDRCTTPCRGTNRRRRISLTAGNYSGKRSSCGHQTAAEHGLLMRSPPIRSLPRWPARATRGAWRSCSRCTRAASRDWVAPLVTSREMSSRPQMAERPGPGGYATRHRLQLLLNRVVRECDALHGSWMAQCPEH
jgi:hypothetical protein